MLILLIQSFDTDKKAGNRAMKSMKKLFESIFHKHGELDVRFMERSYDQLGDLVVDWEHEQLHHTAEDHCLKFDHIDMIIVDGDLQVLPWEPQAIQLVSLIHMAKFTDKPILGVGFGAFAAIYSLATKGARFNVLNGPSGDLIDGLAMFQRYAIGTGAFPSGWLDKETGDMYTFKKQDMSWHPVCNIGIHSIDLKQESILDNEQTLPKTFVLKEDFKTVAPSQQMTITKKSDGTLLHFTPKFLQNKFLRSLPTVQNSFNVKVFHDWRLNRDGSLPPGENLLILAEGKTGPLIIARDRMLLLAIRYDHSQETENDNIVTIMSNFIGDFLLAFRTALSGKIERSLHEFLFGELNRGGDYDTAHHRKPMAPSLAHQAIPTKWNLPEGPVKTEPPIMHMFFRPPKTALDFDFTVLIAKRRSSNVGKKPKQAIQNPLSARQKRLESALARIGYLDQHKAIEKTIAEAKKADPYGLSLLMPEANREMLSGLIMNENSITSRRHRNVEYQRFYESINPKGSLVPMENRLTSSMFSSSVSSGSQPTSPTGLIASFPGGASLLSEVSASHVPFSSQSQSLRQHSSSVHPQHVVDQDEDGDEDDSENDQNTREIRNRRPFNIPLNEIPPELRGYSPEFLDAHRGSLFVKSGTSNPLTSSLISWQTGNDHTSNPATHKNKQQQKVPTIANWVEIYKVSGAGNPIISTSARDTPHGAVPGSARSYVSNTSRKETAKSFNSTAVKPPTSARSSNSAAPKAHRKHHSTNANPQAHQFSPRNAEEILVAKVQSFLPAHHPASIRVGYVDEQRLPSRYSLSQNSSSTTTPSYRAHNAGNNPPSRISSTGSSMSSKLTTPFQGRNTRRMSLLQHSRKNISSHSTDSYDDSEEDEIDPDELVDGVVVVTQSALPPASAIEFYEPPESNEFKEFRDHHIPRILLLSSQERTLSPGKRAQTAKASSIVSATNKTMYRKSYCNYHRLAKQNEKLYLSRSQNYEGTYVTGEYRSEEEQYRRELIENKTKYVAGEFQTCFSQQSTAMAIRPEGLVRPSGPYPDPPNFAVPPNTKAYDWVYMKDLHPRDELLAGHWK